MLLKMTLFFLLITSNAFAKSLYDFVLEDASGEKVSLSDYKDKVVMVTNIATKCGYTPQLDDLEVIYKKYQEKGFVLIGVPSNDFGGQTPEKSEDAAKFCRLKYGVSFPIMKKVQVKGDEKVELFAWIKSQRKDKEEIAWNFEKFLFDKKGNLVEHFKSKVKPLDEKITSQIEKRL